MSKTIGFINYLNNRHNEATLYREQRLDFVHLYKVSENLLECLFIEQIC